MEQMIKVIAHLLFMKQFLHNAHHIVGRVPFFADHEALSSFYTEIDSQYDSLAERFVGIFNPESLSLPVLMSLATEKAKSVQPAKENKDFFTQALMFEKELCSQLDAIIKTLNPSEGTKQLLGDICDKSEARQYKIKMRIR